MRLPSTSIPCPMSFFSLCHLFFHSSSLPHLLALGSTFMILFHYIILHSHFTSSPASLNFASSLLPSSWPKYFEYLSKSGPCKFLVSKSEHILLPGRYLITNKLLQNHCLCCHMLGSPSHTPIIHKLTNPLFISLQDHWNFDLIPDFPQSCTQITYPVCLLLCCTVLPLLLTISWFLA
jgi:hypothetical protein